MGVSRVFQRVYMGFQVCSNGLQEYFDNMSSIFHGCFIGVTRVLCGCIKGVSRVSQGCCIFVSMLIQGCFNCVLKKFQG